MDTKLLGGILLIVGTSIGGGMLALPIATASAGFLSSSLLLFGCWLIMTTGAFLILEVNLWLPPQSNLISMAGATLGSTGQLIAWITNLLLLYSLLAAYIAGGGDFLHNLMSLIGIKTSLWFSSIIFTLLLGFIVYLGIRSIDYVNRGLMITKFGAYLLLVIWILPFVSLAKLMGGEFKYITVGVTVALTSFGYANIIPSLRTYFHGDVTKLRRAILVGSLIPLGCYIAWDLVIMGVIPREGSNGLIAMLHSGHSNSDFVNTLSLLLNKELITVFARAFTTICLATAFLGVSLSLSDFLADGFQVMKQGKGNVIVYAATFLPPLLIVLFYPGAFINALSYAGVYCMILLVLMPAMMAWVGRYRKGLTKGGFQVIGGKPLLIILMVLAILIMGQGIFDNFHLK